MAKYVDLNLLVALRALLTERSVTKAAASVQLSQPAMSASLAKLRRHFGDELLTRNGNTYVLTPLALRLVEPTVTATRAVDRVFAAEPDFDPAAASREFHVVMSDYATAVFAPTLARMLHEQSPGSRLVLHQLTVEIVDRAPESMRTIDVILMPHGFLTDVPHRDVYEDDWVCVVAADNEDVTDALSVEDLARMPFVMVYNSPSAFTTAAKQLSIQGIEPRIEVVTENYLTVAPMIARTKRVGLLQARLGELVATTGLIRVLPCPFNADPLVEAIWWHPMFDRDPAHAWLRELFGKAGIEIT